jgi:DNA-binding NarL/FixJ family response regulator
LTLATPPAWLGTFPSRLGRSRAEPACHTPSSGAAPLSRLTSMIHVALLDDHPAILAGLRRLIEHEPDLLIVGSAPNAPELARQMGEQRADVVVLDDDLERSDGLSHCRRIKSRPHAPAEIIYSAFASHALALMARVAQADAVVDKHEPVSSLLKAIRLAAAGETVLRAIPRDTCETATARLADDDLPVLAMLLGSESLPAIAEALRTDRAEIAWRAQRILGRLRPGATSRQDGQPIDAGGGPVPEQPLH